MIDLILIGAGRSGTTSLFNYIEQHPGINASIIKEVIYFSIEDHFNRGEKYLSSFFAPLTDRQINFTSDTYLLINPEAVQRIYVHNPGIRICAILREPGERAFSSYHYAINNGYEDGSLTFMQTLERESRILEKGNIIDINNLCHFYGSLYHRHLSVWVEIFPREHIFVANFHDLIDQPKQLLNRIFQFAGTANFEVSLQEARNQASKPRNKIIHSFFVNRKHPLRKILRVPLNIPFVRSLLLRTALVEHIKTLNIKNSPVTAMTKEEKDFCDQYFNEDLLALKEEFGVDLS